MNSRILLVDDNPDDLEILTQQLGELGYAVVPAESLAEARKRLEEPGVSVIIADIRLPDGEGSSLLGSVAQPVLLMTAHGEVEEAVSAMRNGAFHYLPKPVRREELAVLLERATDWSEKNRELSQLRRLHGRSVLELDVVVRSTKMREVMEIAEASAESESTVLILGESGTGKEVLAKAIHRLSERSQGPFVPVNCAAIPATLLEAELFGHEKGAFTGAAQRRIGKFERARGGTLFLDEIGTLPVELQSRLLRVLQEHEVERLGGSGSIKVDFRPIAATNLDLSKAVKEGAFREDLFYRLNVVPIQLPPLRDRREEIPALIDHFLRKLGSKSVEIAPDAMEAIMTYDWPGNIRELENAIERAIVLSRGSLVTLKYLPREIRDGALPAPEPARHANGFPTLDDIKKQHVQRALMRTTGRKEEAARILGIHRNTLRNLLNRYHLEAS